MGSSQSNLTGAYYAGVGPMLAYEDDHFFCHVLQGGNVRAVAAVADGMGANYGGMAAAQNALAVIRSLLLARLYGLRGRNLSELELSELLKEAIQKANGRLLRPAVEGPASGAALTAAIFAEDFMVLGHVGDCRAYRLAGGRLAQLTQDHAVGMTLTRRLGKEPAMQIDLSMEPLAQGEIYLLCSNGIYLVLKDEEIREHLETAPTLSQACADMVADALERGGAQADSASAVAVELGQYARRSPNPLRPVAKPTADPVELDQPLPTPNPGGKAKAKPKLKSKPRFRLPSPPRPGRKQLIIASGAVVAALILIALIAALTGGPSAPAPEVVEQATAQGRGIWTKLFGTLLGLAVPAAGVWWWRNRADQAAVARSLRRFK